jgi:CheY-like chemotaxis protein
VQAPRTLGWACVAWLLAAGLTRLLWAPVFHVVPLLAFFVAAVWAAWAFGLWPAVCAGALGALSGCLLVGALGDPNQALAATQVTTSLIVRAVLLVAVAAFVGYLRDRSGRLASRLARTEGRLDAALTQLGEARQEAAEAKQAKSRFLSSLSHELRTPLTPVLAIAGVLEKEPRLPPYMRESLATVRRNVELEAQLIDELLASGSGSEPPPPPVAGGRQGIDAGSTGGAAPAPAQLSILLVEDHADTASALSDLLDTLGYQTTIAGSIAEARAAVERSAAQRAGRQPFDLLVSDLGLPDGNGQDLMREISRRYRFPGIALSGYGFDEDREKSLHAGFARHLIKPIHPRDLQAVIQEVVAAPAAATPANANAAAASHPKSGVPPTGSAN